MLVVKAGSGVNNSKFLAPLLESSTDVTGFIFQMNDRWESKLTKDALEYFNRGIGGHMWKSSYSQELAAEIYHIGSHPCPSK